MKLWSALVANPLPAAAMLGALAVVVAVAFNAGTAADPVGRALYLEHCASCHGVDLEGQPDWTTRNEKGRLPAPPHDASGHTWHHSDAQLFAITKDGLAAIAPGYETDMPAFGDVLSDAEIRQILEYIKSTWPQRERDYQAAR